jgi:GAF domain-containing protein
MLLRRKTLILILITEFVFIGVIIASSRVLFNIFLSAPASSIPGGSWASNPRNLTTFLDTLNITLVFTGLMLTVVTWFILDKKAFSPLQIMNSRIQNANATGNFSVRIPVITDKDFSDLAKSINILLERLELHVKELTRTQEVQRRSIQIRTAAEISRLISAERDRQTLLNKVVTLVKERFGLYYVGVFLTDDANTTAILKAATGEAGQKMVSENHDLPVGGESMIGWTIAHRKARISQNVSQEQIRYKNPYLPDTRSELALPILATDKILGAITIQSSSVNAFDEADITVLQGIADSLATALENARLISEAQENLETIKDLHRSYLAEAWAETLNSKNQPSFEFETNSASESTQPLSTISVPLVLREHVIGSVTLECDRSDWSPDDRLTAEMVASQTSLSLEYARLLDETRRQAAEQQMLADFTSKVWTATNIPTILKTTLQELGKSFYVSDGLISLDLDDPGE